MKPIATDLTIDELARETGMTVRNIRSHATRGLLPPPEVRARTGYYGPEHVARLRLIRELQTNGYNLGAIKHLLSRANGSAEDVLGFARALLAPFENEQPEIVDLAELAARFGTRIEPRVAARAEKLGLVVPLGGGRFEIPSPTLLAAGEAVVALGVPLETVLDLIERVGGHADAVSKAFVRLFMDGVWKPFAAAGEPDADWPKVREALERLRPLATEALVAVFHQRMTQATERAFGRELEKRPGR
jgi:DNA-binding transcriptional MerR regulator